MPSTSYGYLGVGIYVDSGGHIGVGLSESVSNSTTQYSSTVVTDGAQHWGVLVFSNSAGTWSADLYCDGVKVLSAITLASGGTQNLNVVAWASAGTTGMPAGYWTGNLGHALLWYSALSSGTITTLNTAGGWTATTAPSAPVLSGTATPGMNALSWTTPADGGSSITDYSLLRGTSSGGESATPIYTALANAYSDVGLVSGTTYYYEVYATNIDGSSADSNEVTLTFIGALGGLPNAAQPTAQVVPRITVTTGPPIGWGPQFRAIGRQNRN